MSEFKKYMHIERVGSQETEGITDGICHIFYKIDGTNASVWMEKENNNSVLCTGSRNRPLSFENDNAGFHNWIYPKENFWNLLFKYPYLYLYGEWLVPHSLKTYRKDAWKRFYVFDVLDSRTGELLPYEAYKPLLEEFEIDYIPPLAIIKNPTEEDLYRLLQNSGQFLVEDGAGKGEGIVIKNYDYRNHRGSQTWAKIITNEFKEVHHKEMGAPEINGTALIEEQIVRDFLTDEFIKKEQAKIANYHNEGHWDALNGVYVPPPWSNKMIPELLGRVWYEFIREEISEILKKYKNPKINFRLLQSLTIKKVKKVIEV